MKGEYTVVLESKGPNGAWTHATMPFRAEELFGAKGRIAVAGTLNGHPFRSSIMPRGDGSHYLNINKEMLAGANATPGSNAQLVLAVDDQPRDVLVPAELEAALSKDGAAAEIFAGLAYSHRKEYADWVTSGKKAETREARAAKTLTMLHEGAPRR